MLANNITLYNPAEKHKDALVDEFVVRVKIFNRVFKDLRSSKNIRPEQHYIIVGQRGAGKTTLLYRLKYAIEDDSELSKKLLPINLGEEQYSISSLSDLWESLSEILEDYYGYSLLSKKIHQLRESEGGAEDSLFQAICEALKNKGQTITLFIDNFGDLLHKFSDNEIKRLREILMTTPFLRLIAGTPVTLESMFNYSEPFFEFFKIIELKSLTESETKLLLIKLGEINGCETFIGQIIADKPERIEILRRLTGGVIRTMVLLFKIFIENKDGSSIKDLQLIIDSVTPLYKHRMDDLPSQQQKIIDAVAKNWDGIGVKELSAKTRISSKIISSQLRQLEKSQVIEKTTTGSKNHLYHVRERFFNIWYLMRYGRKYDQRRVLWLVRFLETWCDGTELEDRIEQHINNLDSSENYDKNAAILLADAYLACAVPSEVKEKLISTTKAKYPSDFDHSKYNIDGDIFEEALDLKESGDYDKLFKKLEKISPSKRNYEYLIGFYLDFEKFDLALEVLKKIEELNLAKPKDFDLMGIMFEELNEYPNSLNYFDKAIDQNYDLSLLNKAKVLYEEFEEFKVAESLIEKYKERNPKEKARLAHRYAHFYVKKGDLDRAEASFLKAINEGHKSSNFCLGAFYHFEKKDFDLAIKYYLKSIEYGSTPFRNLGMLYFLEKEDHEKAIEYLEKAAAEDDIIAHRVLGHIYDKFVKNFSKSKSYYEKVLKADPSADVYHSLAHICLKTKTSKKKVEKYFKSAIKINKDYGAAACLAIFYVNENNVGKKSEAVKYIELALKNKEEDSTVSVEEHASQVYLWTGDYLKAIDALKIVLNDTEYLEQELEDITSILIDFLAANQTYSILKIFEDESLNLKDLMKPVYYALMILLKEEYPNEHLKMGSEVKETVEELLEEIERRR